MYIHCAPLLGMSEQLHEALCSSPVRGGGKNVKSDWPKIDRPGYMLNYNLTAKESF